MKLASRTLAKVVLVGAVCIGAAAGILLALAGMLNELGDSGNS